MNRSIVEIRNGHQHGPVTSFVSQHNVGQLNPFVLWDHFHAEGLEGTTGFGFHGHSGVATISYPVVGDIVHEDTDGNKGTLGAGGMQLMAAGAGVLHKETIYPHKGSTDAFQLWTLLPKDDAEMGPVTYSLAQQEITPTVTAKESITKVLVGHHDEASSPATHSVDITYLEVQVHPAGQWQHTVSAEQSTGFIYVREGDITLADTQLDTGQLGVLDQSDANLTLTAGESGAVIMVALGQPLDQPIISSGPSIHSSPERLHIGTRNIARLSGTLHSRSNTH